MDTINNNSEKMQQQNSAVSSGLNLMNRSSNRQQIVMIPTPRIIATTEEMQPKTCQSVTIAGTSSLHQTDNQGDQISSLSEPITSSTPPVVRNSQASTSRARHGTMTSSALVANVIPVSTQTPPLLQTNQNLSVTSFNPCADQRLASSSYAPQIDPQVNSTSWRSHANMPDIFFAGNQGTMSGTSINQHHNFMAGTFNSNNGARLVANAISTPTNTQMTTGAGSINPTVAPTASICPPIVRAPSQQGTVQTDAMAQPPMRPNKVPSIYVQQLQKYLHCWSQRPRDNNITFWRQFVTEFFAPDGKRKCCLSACQENAANKFRRSKEKAPCDICKAYSQNGHEISFEELPIFFQSKFNFCKDEVLKLDTFVERNLVNKTIVLYFPTMIEQARHDKFFSIQKGPLAVTFNSSKKILSWQFCMRSCEKLDTGAPDLPMINGHPNAMKNSMDFNSRNHHKIDHMQNCTAQQTLSHQVQSQPISSTPYPSLGVGANNNQVNFPVQQFLNQPSVGANNNQVQSQPILSTTYPSLGENNQVNFPVQQFLNQPSVGASNNQVQSQPILSTTYSSLGENNQVNFPVQQFINQPSVGANNNQVQSQPISSSTYPSLGENNQVNFPVQLFLNQSSVGANNNQVKFLAQQFLNQSSVGANNHQVQSQPMSSTTYPILGANNNQFNFPAQQFLNQPSVLDTSASRFRPVTSTTASLVSPNIITNPLFPAPNVDARSLPDAGASGPTNTLKRACTTENEVCTDVPELRVIRQRLEDALSGNGVEIGSESGNLALTAGLTEGSAADENIGSSINTMHGSRVNTTEQQLDEFFEGTEPGKEISDLLEFLFNQ